MAKKPEKGLNLDNQPEQILIMLPVMLHAALLEEAKREGVTLEELTLSALSRSVGRREGHRSGVVCGSMTVLNLLAQARQDKPKRSKKKGKR